MNACGTATAISRLASIPPISTRRTGTASGSNQFAIQVVLIHAHHTTSSRKAVRSSPPTVGSTSSAWESCVTAKT